MFEADVVPLSPGERDRLHQLFVERGPVGRDDIDVMKLRTVLGLAEVVCSRVTRDVKATIGETVVVTSVVLDDDGVARVQVDRQVAGGTGLFSVEVEELTAELADLAQDEVLEQIWAAWPECQRHHVGLHPQVVDRTASPGGPPHCGVVVSDRRPRRRAYRRAHDEPSLDLTGRHHCL